MIPPNASTERENRREMHRVHKKQIYPLILTCHMLGKVKNILTPVSEWARTFSEKHEKGIAHVMKHNHWYMLAISSLILVLSAAYFVYERQFDTKALLIAESVSLQREKLESEAELKDLQRRISVYNSMADEHNTQVKSVTERLKHYNDAKSEKSASSSFILSLLVFIASVGLFFGGRKAYDYHSKHVVSDRKYRMKLRKYTFGFYQP